MFWTLIGPSSGATFNKLYIRADTNVPIALYSLLNVAPDDGPMSPKHVEPFNEKIKIIYKNLCISLVYIRLPVM